MVDFISLTKEKLIVPPNMKKIIGMANPISMRLFKLILRIISNDKFYIFYPIDKF